MRIVLLAALAAVLAAGDAEAGRRRPEKTVSKPVHVYFPASLDTSGAPTDAGRRLAVSIPAAVTGAASSAWITIFELDQGDCLRYDLAFAGDAAPYWIRACWADAPELCSATARDCDPNDPMWTLRNVPVENRCTVAMCGRIY